MLIFYISCITIGKPLLKETIQEFAKKNLWEIVFKEMQKIFCLKRLWQRCLSVNFAKFLRASFFIEHLWWLLVTWFTFLEFSDSTDFVLLNAEPIGRRCSLKNCPENFHKIHMKASTIVFKNDTEYSRMYQHCTKNEVFH